MTTVPQVKKALQATLQDALGTSPIVHRGYPGQEALDSRVIVGKARGTQEQAALGTGAPRKHEESYTVDVVLQVYDEAAESQDSVTETAYAWLDVIESALKANPNLGGVCRRANVESWDDDEAPGEYGFLCLLNVRVRVQARV